MSGFVAIIADDPDGKVSEHAIRGFADAYAAVRGRADETSAQAGARARACVFAGPDRALQALHRRGASWAAIAGAAHGARAPIDAEPEELEGQFALLRYDDGSGVVTLASDPFGMFGLFIANRDGQTFASTSAVALARQLGARPSRLGVETFLLAGYHCGSRTSWEGIERVRAGTALRFGSHGRTESTYWRPAIDPAIRRLDVRQSVDRCLEPAIEAVRATGGQRRPVWCDLTGGYDSRLLCLLARAAGLDFLANTSGTPDEEDVRLAREIAGAAGWDWTLFTLPQRWSETLPELLEPALGWGDAALDVLQLSGVLWAHRAKAERTPRLLNAGGGEHYWSYAWQHEYGRAGRSGRPNVGAWVRFRMLRPVPTGVFARDPRADVIEDLCARMAAVVEPYRDEPRATQADLLYAHKGTGHFGAYAAAAGAYLDVLLPFYTRASFTAALSTNPRHRFGHRFYRHLIERMDPTIAAIGTAKGGPAQPLRLSNVRAYAPYYARTAEKGFNKLAHKVAGRSFRRPPAVGDSDAAAARAAAVSRVGSDIALWRSSPLYDGAELKRMLADAGRADFPNSVLLGRILTVELAMRAGDVALT